MRKVQYLLLFFLFISGICKAQKFAGDWNGTLKFGSQSLPLVFHFIQNGNGWSGTMDSPKQEATGIPISTVSMVGDSIQFQITTANIHYRGKLDHTDSVIGIFSQNGMVLPLSLKRGTINTPALVRPQTPKPPFPYTIEEVQFANPVSGNTLAGTLTLPKGTQKHTCLILVTGSGPQNRDEEIVGHHTFGILADFLTRNGYAVLRYDDRGVGKSNGDYATATIDSFATDAFAAVKYLKSRKDIGKNGLLGHSEGGQIITQLAATHPKDIAFMIMMAGPGLRGDSLLLLQTNAVLKHQQIPDSIKNVSQQMNRSLYQIVLQNKNRDSGISKIVKYFQKVQPNSSTKDIAVLKAQFSPEIYSLISFDPAPYLQKINFPILALNGSEDIQVLPKENLDGIRKATAHNKKVTIEELPGLNHLFQQCTQCTAEEYGELEQTISPTALNAILAWLNKTIR